MLSIIWRKWPAGFNFHKQNLKQKSSNKMGLYKDYLPLEYLTHNVVGTKPKIFQPHISSKRWSYPKRLQWKVIQDLPHPMSQIHFLLCLSFIWSFLTLLFFSKMLSTMRCFLVLVIILWLNEYSNLKVWALWLFEKDFTRYNKM